MSEAADHPLYDDDLVDHEDTLIGGLLIQPAKIADCPSLSPADFQSEFLGECLRAIRDLGPDADVTQVADAAQADRLKLIAGGNLSDTERDRVHEEMQLERARLCDCFACSVPNLNIPWHADMIKRRAWKRRIASGADTLKYAAWNGKPDRDIANLCKDVGEFSEGFTTSQDELRELLPAEVLADEMPETDWTVNGWLARRDVTCIAAEPAIGKSFLLLELALAISQGRMFLGSITTRGPQKVLYVDEENSRRIVHARYRKLLLGQPGQPRTPMLRYLAENGINIDSNRAPLDRAIDEFEPDWIFLDSLVRFHTRNENDNSAMSDFFSDVLAMVRNAGAGLVFLHHLAKPSKDRPELAHRLRGASDLAAVVDGLWFLEGDRATSNRTLTQTKCRHVDHLAEPLGIELVEIDTAAGPACAIRGSTVRLSAEKLIVGLLEAHSPAGIHREEIVAYVRARGFSDRYTEKAVKDTLGKMRAEGSADSRKDGRRAIWYLTPKLQ